MKQTKTAILASLLLLTIPAFASPEAVQGAQCPKSLGGGAFACCENDDWNGPLWVSTKAAVNSSQNIRNVCWTVNGDFNAWGGNCDYSTHIFNNPANYRISTDCAIHNYKPFSGADAADGTKQMKKKQQ